MRRKTIITLVLLAIAVGWLVHVGIFSQAMTEHRAAKTVDKQSVFSAAKPISLEEAKAIATSFVGEERAAKMRYIGLFLRKRFPPFRMCYRFKIPLPVEPLSREEWIRDPKAPKGIRIERYPGEPIEAELWIDKDEGIVVTYDPDLTAYGKAKYQGKGPPKENEIIHESKAIEIAKQALALARIPMEGMRLTIVRLDRPGQVRDEDIYRHYTVIWRKYLQIPSLGEVEFPTSVLTCIDARTGELDQFLFKEYPVVISLSPPKVSKERAIELARKVCKLQEICKVDAHLKIDFDPEVPDWNNWEEIQLWADDPPRYYREIGLKRQALVWEVRIKGKFTYPFVAPGRIPEPKDAEWIGIVNAMTGKVTPRGLIPED